MLAGFWHQIPFVRIIIPMTIGIGINFFYPMPITIITAFLSISYFSLFIALFIIMDCIK
jgi:hypothetical protein